MPPETPGRVSIEEAKVFCFFFSKKKALLPYRRNMSSPMTQVLTNAALVLPDQMVRGHIVLRDGLIAELHPGPAPGTDLEGDYLLPGAVDLHTDNLERQVEPRQNARWPSRPALLAHDSQCAAAGITTVFNALCIGQAGWDNDRPRTCAEGVADMAALAPSGLLKAEHFLHLRCELPTPDMLAQLEAYLDHAALRMVSLMDHTPGSGQFGDVTSWRAMQRQDGLDAHAIDTRLALLRRQQAEWRSPNRAGLLARLAGRLIVTASHDDATEADIAANIADGIGTSEFPVGLAAACAAKAGGMRVIAGAPNLVRGGSHSGNVAVSALLASGLVDALASDYVPASLIHAAFLAAAMPGSDLPASLRLITRTPALMAGLDDRGAIAPGLRADLVRVRVHDGVPVVRQVWRAGERVI